MKTAILDSIHTNLHCTRRYPSLIGLFPVVGQMVLQLIHGAAINESSSLVTIRHELSDVGVFHVVLDCSPLTRGGCHRNYGLTTSDLLFGRLSGTSRSLLS
jgi:hypothetical protein